jgi:hypothetical protein
MRAVILRFYNKRLSESRASEQNQEQPMGAGWTAYASPLISTDQRHHDWTLCRPVRPQPTNSTKPHRNRGSISQQYSTLTGQLLPAIPLEAFPCSRTQLYFLSREACIASLSGTLTPCRYALCGIRSPSWVFLLISCRCCSFTGRTLQRTKTHFQPSLQSSATNGFLSRSGSAQASLVRYRLRGPHRADP